MAWVSLVTKYHKNQRNESWLQRRLKHTFNH